MFTSLRIRYWRFKNWLFFRRMTFRTNYLSWRWKFPRWLFSWRQDEDGDIAFVICNRLACIKYKESTIFRWAANLEPADKYQGHVEK